MVDYYLTSPQEAKIEIVIVLKRFTNKKVKVELEDSWKLVLCLDYYVSQAIIKLKTMEKKKVKIKCAKSSKLERNDC